MSLPRRRAIANRNHKTEEIGVYSSAQRQSILRRASGAERGWIQSRPLGGRDRRKHRPKHAGNKKSALGRSLPFMDYLAESRLSASAASCASVSGFRLERIETKGSTMRRFFIGSRMAFMHLPAEGAQEPFSTNATTRF